MLLRQPGKKAAVKSLLRMNFSIEEAGAVLE